MQKENVPVSGGSGVDSELKAKATLTILPPPKKKCNSSATKAQRHPSTICWTYGVNKEGIRNKTLSKREELIAEKL